ncbi:MAG: toprim domain-containing protein [Acidobacteriota bacterium]
MPRRRRSRKRQPGSLASSFVRRHSVLRQARPIDWQREHGAREGVMAAAWVSFKQIKADVAIEQVLERYGVRLRRVGGELRGPCPLPTHTSRLSRDSFSVSPARNAWSCRSQSCMQARGGKAGGNILDFVAIMEGCSLREAALRLQDSSGTMPGRRSVPVEASKVVPNAPLPFALQYIDGHHPYLAARELTAETVRTFGIGAYRGRGFLRDRVVIPIHDATGALIAYAGRAIDGHEPKYRFPTGFRKSLVLFNLHRVLHTGARTVIVVEGFFDALAVHQAGYHAVVALMGSTLSRPQTDLLTTHFDRVVVMLDGDDAGRQGTAAITTTLAGSLDVVPILLDEHTQPDQLAPVEIRRLVDGPSRG